MPRRNTKSDRILNNSAMRLAAAEIRERTAQSELNAARAIREALQQAHDALVRELTPTPRKKAEKPSASPPAQKESTPDKEAKCGVCYEVEDHPNHDSTYLSSHKFDAPKAGRKSRKKSEPPAVIPSSDTGADGNGLAAEMES